jgi:hypothetical protein
MSSYYDKVPRGGLLYLPRALFERGPFGLYFQRAAVIKRMLGPAAELAEMWRDQVRMYVDVKLLSWAESRSTSTACGVSDSARATRTPARARLISAITTILC